MDSASRQRLLGHDRRESRELRESPRASSELSDSGLDVTELLDNNDPIAPSPSDRKPRRKPVRIAPLRRSWWKRPRWLLIAAIVVASLWAVIAAANRFLYKKNELGPAYGDSPPWYPSPKGGSTSSWAASYEKAAKLVSRMTLAEKINITTGTGWMMDLAVGTTGPALRVGFPPLYLQDGPLGIRFSDGTTAFPAGITAATTWNRELIRARGAAHGAEARAKGVNALLGPCVGPLGRAPAGGRNWEGFGPDPYLAGVCGAETIHGIQGQHVMATIKHFVGNEQEHFRQAWEWGIPYALSSNIDDRALHELYAWPFGDAVRAGVASVMCSYNMVNNSYACGNSKLLNGVLKDELGFQGFVMSDWLAQRGGVSSALAGLDVTMPGDGLKWQDGISLWGPELSRAVLNSSLPVERLNDMVTRVVAAWYQLGQDDETLFPVNRLSFSSWTEERMGVMAPGSSSPQEEVEVNQFVNVQGDHSAIARRVAAEGIVLLKNDHLLPLSPSGNTAGGTARPRDNGKRRIAVFGEDAGPGLGPNYCRDRGCNQGTLGSGWGSGAVEFPHLITPADALDKAFDDLAVEFTAHLTNSPDLSSHPEIAGDQDLCIVLANADSGEGFLTWSGIGGDRLDLALQMGGDDLILSVANACGGDVVVVIHSVGPVVMERWINHPAVKAVLLANLPGQESGYALADVLFGDVNPSGRLPYTMGKSLADYGPGGQVMYIPNGTIPQQDFSEGIFIDYRHFDKAGIEPRFEFGFGLSYTTFAFSNLRIAGLRSKTAMPAPRPDPEAIPPSYDTSIPSRHEVDFPDQLRKLDKYVYPYLDSTENVEAGPYPYPEGYDQPPPLSGAGGGEGGNPDLWEPYVRVTVDVTNTGGRSGQAVAQLYMSYPSEPRMSDQSVDFPVRVLRGFDKVPLAEGETKSVGFNVTRRDLSYWCVQRQNWVLVTEDQYIFAVGASSRDLSVSGKW